MRLTSAFARRLLPLLLVLTLPVAVQAQYNYLIDNGTITITENNCFDGAVAIPDAIEGLPVTSIGDSAFSGCTSLTSVTIPNSVTSIGDYVFYGCISLPAVYFKGNTPRCGEDVFRCGRKKSKPAVAWHTQLAPEALRRLDQGMEGVLRRSILKLLPAEQLGEHFNPAIGRPSKELYAMSGLLLLGEFRDWTIDQAADAWSFDASVQFAPNLPRDR